MVDWDPRFFSREAYRSEVREHHAPVGALRLLGVVGRARAPQGQGAPRTCRCIETRVRAAVSTSCLIVREHHAPVGALRLRGRGDLAVVGGSGSTTHL